MNTYAIKQLRDICASYSQSNNEYRDLMRSDIDFQKEFLHFYTGNVFTN